LPCVVISFNYEALVYARKQASVAIGWIITTWDEANHQLAKELTPDYLICNYRKVPFDNGGLWTGPWAWALYDVTDPALALQLHQQGADMISTFAIGDMLADPLFANHTGGDTG
jgi:glycerophosphoryl diester phosphodiesterase